MLVSKNGNTSFDLKSGTLEAKDIKIKNTGGSDVQGKVKELEEKVSTLEQTISSLASRVSDSEGNITVLTQTIQSLESKVESK